MQEKDNLILLIRRLNRAEVKYFRWQASLAKEGSVYLQLFEFIHSKKKVSDQEMMDSFGITPKKLANRKNHLKKLILKNLSDFHPHQNYKLRIHKKQRSSITQERSF